MRDDPKNEKGPGGNRSPLENTDQQPKFSAKSTATEAQLSKLLARLCVRPHHTYELRQCGISHPAGRVLNLQQRGYVIKSDRITTVDSDAYTHHGVALYSLLGKPEGAGQ